ncbi:hypothetical protein SAMN04489712_105245 [Thermomonospora echinospora]|uniref:Uncharacterized protein n=1 Tax=Thermomonospora echinospora TaxID=1992 RepID=A0A1H6A8D6_9ACTN|nr:hypothetical protein [Thermomonospora echinospora]SEG44307.1 hypothetical protein SAMN04489712_105245 [Thermomonospora echinospora]
MTALSTARREIGHLAGVVKSDVPLPADRRLRCHRCRKLNRSATWRQWLTLKAGRKPKHWCGARMTLVDISTWTARQVTR